MNAIVIRLPASLQDDLDWSSARSAAEQAVALGQSLLWEIDFNFSSIRSRDTASFFAYSRAIEEFAKQLWPLFKTHTSGVCIYRGTCHFEQLLDRQIWQDQYDEWLMTLREKAYPQHELKNEDIAHEHYYRLFSAQMVAEYFDRLISFFPDEIAPVGFFTSDFSLATTAQLLSKERFQHLHCFTSTSPVKEKRPSLAVCLPSDSYCDRSLLVQLDQLFDILRKQGTSYRLICEEKLAEEWDELDQLMVISQAVSPSGKRKLQGFCAAGGEVVYYTLIDSSFALLKR